MKNIHKINDNIYITSDEEIKEGDWICDIELNRIEQCLYSGTFRNWKKIILTTDQDLIKDGVQAIDDEFLEWFVKNPSCEKVEVGYGWIRLTETDNEGYWVSIPDKQFEMQQEEPKQETLEEAANRFSKVRKKALKYKKEWMPECIYHESFNGFIVGAEYQAERMYSEEDMRLAFETGRNFQLTGEDNFNELIEQFKNKQL